MKAVLMTVPLRTVWYCPWTILYKVFQNVFPRTVVLNSVGYHTMSPLRLVLGLSISNDLQAVVTVLGQSCLMNFSNVFLFFFQRNI